MRLTRGGQDSAAGRAAGRWSAPNPSVRPYRPRHRPCPRLGRRAIHPRQSAERRPERLRAVGRRPESGHRRETEARPGWELRPESAHRPGQGHRQPPAHRPCPRLGRLPARTPHLLPAPPAAPPAPAAPAAAGAPTSPADPYMHAAPPVFNGAAIAAGLRASAAPHNPTPATTLMLNRSKVVIAVNSLFHARALPAHQHRCSRTGVAVRRPIHF